MDPIDHIDFRAWDLNLVVALDALLQERSVTAAARRAGLGQPAMSHALARLRALLGDELLVRSGRVMEPTSRAVELADPVREALLQLRSAFRERRPFVPETADRTFFLGMTDYTEALLLPGMAARLVAAAPGVRVVARTVDRERGHALLDQGRLDAAVGVFPEVADRHRAQGLFTERYLCLYDPAQLELRLPLRREDYLVLRHVAVSPEEEAAGPLDRLLAERGLVRTIAVATPRYLSAPLLLKEAPLAATVPGRLARLVARTHGLAVCDLPFDLGSFQMSLVWHRRNDAEPGSAWFRSEVSRLARTLT